jgi:hypothetical protein
MPGSAPHDLDSVRRLFDSWRAQRKQGARIPVSLWEAAAQVAARLGVSKTSLALRLDYYGLKDRVETAISAASKGGFVEIALPVTALPTECVVELEDGDGRRLRVELRGAATAAIDAVVVGLWGTGR